MKNGRLTSTCPAPGPGAPAATSNGHLSGTPTYQDLRVSLSFDCMPATSACPFRQFTRQEFQWTEAYYFYAFFSRHDLDTKEANSLLILSGFSGVVEGAHRYTSSVRIQPKSSFLMSKFAFQRTATVVE